MEEEKQTRSAPPRNSYRLIKIATLTVLFLALFFTVGGLGLKATTSSTFCSSCHEMKPEYYTWKTSAHSEVDCVNCHVGSGVEKIAKSKANTVVELYKKGTDTYTAPIQMPKDIPNSACEECHNMENRKVTPSGDLIIPHDKHLEKDIKCTQCHSGVAHGDISERNVTFKSDYSKWDGSLAKSMMTVKYTEPKMQTCMDCHKARNIATDCETCHSSNMVPKSHTAADFKAQGHGKLADKDIQKCDSCHQYMSSDEIKDITNAPASQQFLKTGSTKQETIPAKAYAKENTYCKNCHTGTRPESHGANYVNAHGALAKQDKSGCMACHGEQSITVGTTSNGLTSNAVSTSSTGTAPACNSCHPASHDNSDYRQGHPIDLTGITAPSAKCYTCHSEQKCKSCHKES
ncbi:NapC/NirT family cytochrome c [Neobacillus muris]|uniref:NapC/NirT family cytochrome c n=1 Tax=Neobacillus muris TaxID=2941334 RepID=UPI00203E0539|nr:NapC/NirT family cytochrome c [Neobacillus muris]